MSSAPMSKDEMRFWDKVRIGDGCWEWTASRRQHGYGQFTFNGRHARKAHRVAWELTHGHIPSGIHVLHQCDNPGCVRPGHLRLGTHAENMAEMAARGRAATAANGRRRCPPPAGGYPTGEAASGAKLQERDVREIRRLLREGVGHREVGRRFGVHHATVGAIANGVSWRHVA